MKYNKNTGTLLFLLLFTTGQCEKNIEKTLFVKAADSQKRWKTAGSEGFLPQYQPNLKSKFLVKFVFT